ncbi:MAG: SIS domain-containing protein [Bacteroidales bacterium]|jgi:glucosamine--fructose-6-phosphate aminotransferase (isomerizing)|nr:SIS domain-containing protein [Bacteroidales bacterium]
MNLNDNRYNRFALVREMMETPQVISGFDSKAVAPFADAVKRKEGIFLTGEGSSRIFPAKRAMYARMVRGCRFPVMTEGSTQAIEYNLDDYAVFGASNSGKTKEIMRLMVSLRDKGHDTLLGLTANAGTPLCDVAHMTHLLTCGKENAVAATKSVVEQALFYDAIQHILWGEPMTSLSALAEGFEKALRIEIDQKIVSRLVAAPVIWFAGKNDGVAEELALKTNEITRKRSDFLEGTYAAHGIEEVMNPDEVLIWADPFEEEEEKFYDILVKGVGMTVIAISARPTRFPTLLIPGGLSSSPYIQLAAGWNLLVETGIALGVDLDHPVRARKVGNEYLPG